MVPSEKLVGKSATIVALRTKVQQLGPTGVPVLIEGETGTGKELVARLLHEHSEQSGLFVPINCGAVAQTLFEREMFGHVKGAFTGADRSRPGFVEQAGGGTLFLDEVGELDPSGQVKLLRVLESGEFSPVGSPEIRRAQFRLVAATNRALGAAMGHGKFRPDLYYRLATICLRIPPLRARPEDLGPLIRHLIGDRECAKEALEILRRHSWPGNVRELRATLESAAALAGDGPILPDHLELAPLSDQRVVAGNPSASRSSPRAARSRAGRYDRSGTEQEEREDIVGALRATAGNKRQAARRLGMARSTLYLKLREHSIGPAEWSVTSEERPTA